MIVNAFAKVIEHLLAIRIGQNFCDLFLQILERVDTSCKLVKAWSKKCPVADRAPAVANAFGLLVSYSLDCIRQ